MHSLSELIEIFRGAPLARPPEGLDFSLRLTSRTIGTPIACQAGVDAAAAVRAFAAGARVLELDVVEAALRTAIVLDVVRASGALPDGEFGGALVVVRLPERRTGADAMLEAIGGSTGAAAELASSLPREQADVIGASRPLTAVELPAPRGLDEETETFARAILQEWGDDLVIAFGASSATDGLGDLLAQLRSLAESQGCTLAFRAPAGASAPLLSALAAEAAQGMPVWLDAASPAEVPAALARGGSIVSAPGDVASCWSALSSAILSAKGRRPSDLVLFGASPDESIKAAAKEIYAGGEWFASRVKNALLALHRLSKVDSPLVRQSLAAPPPACCLYDEADPDLREAATAWLYDRWIREQARRRLPVG